MFTDTSRGVRNRRVARAWESGLQADANGFTNWLLISKFEVQKKLISDSLLERML